MKNFIKNKNFWFPKTLYELRKKYWGKIVQLKNIYKFTADYFFIGQVDFVLIVKKVIKNEKFHFIGNTECSQVPSDICTVKFDIFDHNHL